MLLALLMLTGPLHAEDPKPRSRDLVAPEVFIPVPPYEHERLHYFGRPDLHVVPGAVSINRAPYRCDLDQRSFSDREAFVAHLRTAHKTPLDEIPARIVLRDGLVHFIPR